MSVRALVTGGAGFVGQWLVRALLERDATVIATTVETAPPPAQVLTAAQLERVQWMHADIRRSDAIEAVVETAQPDWVFHLAGLSFVPDAQDAPALAYDINVLGVVRLLATLQHRRRAGLLDPVVLVVGSGMQYGRHDTAEMPLTESAELRPLTVYAASKAAQETAALQTWRAEGLRVVCTRSFNHSGVGHAPHFLLPALVRRAVAVRERGDRQLAIGNADAVRDYLHVADVVSAYLLLAERGTPGEVYNVCSGDGVSARQLASDVLLRVGASADISTDPALVRTTDVPALVGSPRKLQALGWRSARSRADIIDDLIHAATH